MVLQVLSTFKLLLAHRALVSAFAVDDHVHSEVGVGCEDFSADFARYFFAFLGCTFLRAHVFFNFMLLVVLWPQELLFAQSASYVVRLGVLVVVVVMLEERPAFQTSDFAVLAMGGFVEDSYLGCGVLHSAESAQVLHATPRKRFAFISELEKVACFTLFAFYC